MIMCHLVADTPAELLEMAQRIGIKLHWFQATASTPHFDISLSKRQLALDAGALPLDRRGLVAKIREIRQTWPRLPDGSWVLA